MTKPIIQDYYNVYNYNGIKIPTMYIKFAAAVLVHKHVEKKKFLLLQVEVNHKRDDKDHFFMVFPSFHHWALANF